MQSFGVFTAMPKNFTAWQASIISCFVRSAHHSYQATSTSGLLFSTSKISSGQLNLSNSGNSLRKRSQYCNPPWVRTNPSLQGEIPVGIMLLVASLGSNLPSTSLVNAIPE